MSTRRGQECHGCGIFQQLADQWNVSLHITSAGTEPDAEVAPAVEALLRAEGIDVADQRPRRVTAEELAAASLVLRSASLRS